MENIKLTSAQQQYLIQLNTTMSELNGRIKDFVSYLRLEHNAPEQDYDINNINDGFVPKITKE